MKINSISLFFNKISVEFKIKGSFNYCFKVIYWYFRTADFLSQEVTWEIPNMKFKWISVVCLWCVCSEGTYPHRDDEVMPESRALRESSVKTRDLLYTDLVGGEKTLQGKWSGPMQTPRLSLGKSTNRYQVSQRPWNVHHEPFWRRVTRCPDPPLLSRSLSSTTTASSRA